MPSAESETQTTTILIRELFHSAWFDTDLLLLQDETRYQNIIAPDGERIHHVALQNSVQLSLGCVRAFQKYCNCCSPEDMQSISSICLDDIFVTISERNGSKTEENESRSEETKAAELRRQGSENKKNPEEGTATTLKSGQREEGFELRAGFFSSFDIMGADAYEEFITSAKDTDYVRDGAPVKPDVGQTRDADGVELGMGYFSALSRNQEHLQKNTKGKTQNQSTPKESTTKSAKKRILLDLDIISPISIETTHQKHAPVLNDAGSIRLLGCLLYSVFSKGAEPPTHFQSSGSVVESPRHNVCPENVSCGEGRKSKSPPSGESTILLQLLDGNTFPISICHLLSDMIDIGSNGKASNPFRTVDEVIQDLEEMKAHPHLFLYDRPNNSLTSIPVTPVFGRQYHGRAKELTQLLGIPTRLESIEAFDSFQSHHEQVEAIFLSGRAGSGKSHLIKKCGDVLSTQGWIVVSEKFDRGLEHKSQSVVCSLFDKVVKVLTHMKHSVNQCDAECSLRARKLLTDRFDNASLCVLATYLPNLRDFIDVIDIERASFVEANLSHWKLVFLLSRFLHALLDNDRPIMLILDDMQWSDALSLDLVLRELLESVADRRNAHRFLFAGLYRDNEVSDAHPLYSRLLGLRKCKSINVTDIQLSAFSKDDIADMIAAELRLPTRIVTELGGVIHKKTSGHILFAVELLNSMVRDSTISFSLKNRRYYWRWDVVWSLKTDDNVASFILSTLSTLQPEILHALRVLSCLGFQSDLAVLDLLNESCVAPSSGFRSCLHDLMDVGIIDIAGGLVSFTHDLIQQHVYEGMELIQRENLHYDIGVFLGAKALATSSSTEIETLEMGFDHIYISGSKSTTELVISERSLLSIAIDQINSVGPEVIVAQSHRTLFAHWNLLVGGELSQKSEFGCALYYYENGIRFIGRDVWLEDFIVNGLELCLSLYEGAAVAALATKKDPKVEFYTNVIFQNVTFEKSLPAWVTLLLFLESSGKYNEVLEMGISLLRRLNFDIPRSPPGPKAILESFSSTSRIVNSFDISQIADSNNKLSYQHNKNLFMLYIAIIIATYAVSSSYYPLLTFEMVQYSIRHVFFAPESAVALATFGHFHIAMDQDYSRAKFWADIALEILKNNLSTSASVRVKWIVYAFIMMWFVPLKDSSRNLYVTYELGMKVGDFTLAMYALGLSTRYSLFEGENLSLISQSLENNMKKMIKYNADSAKFYVLDKMIVDELRGEESNPFAIFEGEWMSDDDLINDALASNNTHLLENLYFRRFYSAFWRGDFQCAESYSKMMLSLPSSKRPKLILIFFTFFRGLIAFQRYREKQSEEQLGDGIEAISNIELWSQHAPSNFENKLLLLKAEQYASLPNIEVATSLYTASIQSARDNGRVHEQGLAYELMGNFLSTVAKSSSEARKSWKRAHECYLQWGALVKAASLYKKHGLDDTIDDCFSLRDSSLKHNRDEL